MRTKVTFLDENTIQVIEPCGKQSIYEACSYRELPRNGRFIEETIFLTDGDQCWIQYGDDYIESISRLYKRVETPNIIYNTEELL